MAEATNVANARMEEKLAKLRIKLAEAEAQATEEKRRREEEQHKPQRAEAQAAEEQRREEEQRQREAAEADAQPSRPNDLIEYLEACHSFSLTLEVVTNTTLTTRGDTTKPAGRPFPRRVVPWDDFPAEQEKVWNVLSTSACFNTQHTYPSAHQLAICPEIPRSDKLGAWSSTLRA